MWPAVANSKLDGSKPLDVPGVADSKLDGASCDVSAAAESKLGGVKPLKAAKER